LTSICAAISSCAAAPSDMSRNSVSVTPRSMTSLASIFKRFARAFFACSTADSRVNFILLDLLRVTTLRHRKFDFMPRSSHQCPVFTHYTQVLNDLNARRSQLLGHLVIANSQLHPDGLRFF